MKKARKLIKWDHRKLAKDADVDAAYERFYEKKLKNHYLSFDCCMHLDFVYVSQEDLLTNKCPNCGSFRYFLCKNSRCKRRPSGSKCIIREELDRLEAILHMN